MARRVLIGAIALVAIAVPASSASADGGNVATGSVGTTQVGSTGTGPELSGPGGTTVTVPVTIVGTGGNTSNGSIGTAQVGDGNTSSGSVGTAQVSSVHGRPAAQTDTRVVHARTSAPVAVPGSGPNSASGSAVTVQLGGGHSTNGSFARVRANRVSAQPRASAGTGTGTLVQVGTPGSPSVVLLLGPPKPRANVAAALTHDFKFNPASLLFQATAVGVQPDVLAAVDPIAALTFGGVIGTGPNGGNAAPDSLGTAQLGSVTIAPVVGLHSAALGSKATVGGSSGVDGTGSNLADRSLGTAQAGGGNTAGTSAGTLQVGGLFLAPAGSLATPYGTAGLGGSSGIAGGSNTAAGSLGTVQIGGGNTSNGSAGTVQAGSVTVGPTAQTGGTPAGDAALGGSSGVAGSGNAANGSLGTAQIGGGNGAAGSGGTAQSSGITFGQHVTAAGVSAGGPTNVGRGSGNSASSSLGTAQVGGGNSATNSIGTAQFFGSARQPSGGPSPVVHELSPGPPSPLPATRSAAGTTPASVGKQAAAQHSSRSSSGSRQATKPPVLGAHHATSGTLPFTGIDLLYAALAGLALTGAGLRLRRRATA